MAQFGSSGGSFNRASSAIDDFKLTYISTVGVSDVSAQPELSLITIGNATPDNITLNYTAEEAGSYILNIYDLAGRNIHTQQVNAPSTSQNISVTGLHLAQGMYIAKMHNGNSSSVTRIMIQ